MHKVLIRQIQKTLGENITNPPAGWDEFIRAISETYQHNDEDRELIERSLDLTSREMTTLNERLHRENEIIEQKVEERTEELAEEQAKLQASINNLGVGFIMLDTNRQIININSAAKNIFFSLYELQNNNDPNKKTNDQPTLAAVQEKLGESLDLPEAIQQVLDSRAAREYREVAFGNRFLKFFLNPILFYENPVEVIGAVILVEDITEAKIIERSKDEFFSIASHELRTPLTAIRGYADLIQTSYSPVLEKNTEVKRMITNIMEASDRLMSIVNDFLNISRLEQGKFAMHQTEADLESVITEEINELTGIAKKKKLYLKYEKPYTPLPPVFIDKDKTKQVIANLVSNGFKFTEKGGITISIRPSDLLVKVLVSDTGTGIPERNQKYLFHKFQQANDNLYTRDSEKGTGLGLYISRLIMKYMGGDVGLEHSEENKGSIFYFTVPVYNGRGVIIS